MVKQYQSDQVVEKTVLVVGFFALAFAVLGARLSPATAYELSIYSGTPIEFWGGAAVAMAAAIGVAFYARDVVQLLALILAGATTAAIAALPIIRNYFFFGSGDSLTHLGWAREISAGVLNPLDLLYPGIHVIAVGISKATAVPVRRTLLLTVFIFILIYLIFVPFCVWTIKPQGRAATIATLAACLLLPINGISLFMQPHPASQAILFFPFPLFLAIRYLTGEKQTAVPFLPSSFGVLLTVSSLAILLVHPQQTANVLVVYAAIVGVQWLYSVVRPNHRIVTRYRSLLGQTGFLTALMLVWMPTHQRASGSVAYLVRELLFGSNPAASDIQQHAGGLAQIGGGIKMMFVKLFLISFIFCLIAGITLLTGVTERLETPRANDFSNHILVGLVPLFGLFAAYLITSTGGFHFRQLGFIMVLVTIFGAIGLSFLSDRLDQLAPSHTIISSAFAVLFAVMIVLSVLSMFHSPFVYQSSGHVTEGEMTGYATAFEHRSGPPFIGLRSPGTRIADALYGVREKNPRPYLGGSLYADTPVVGSNFTARNISHHYNSTRYLFVTDAARQREVKVYNGLRFPQKGFRSLSSRPGIARVQSGGGVQLYLVNRTAESPQPR